MRKTWYSFRWAVQRQIPGRLVRLFARGEREEDVVADDLARAGIALVRRQEGISDYHGHIQGHIDGVLESAPWFDSPALVEIKTANSRRFKRLKDGVAIAEPQYYVQCQMYMGYLGLDKALFVATNKDDEHRYVEIIDYDQAAFESYRNKAVAIVCATTPPAAPGNCSATWYECKYCDAYALCWQGGQPEPGCRTCKSVAIDGAHWICRAKNKVLALDEQRTGCLDWTPID